MKLFRVREEKIIYTDTSKIDADYTDKMNLEYNWMAKAYSVFMFFFPLWKIWIKKVIPHIEGQKILEVSFGNGYLMTEYGKNSNYSITGIDYNEKMIEITEKKLQSKKIKAKLLQANVEKLPFENNTFNTVINTMAFTGYPDGDKALSEIKRVLKPGGKLLMVDFDYPKNRNFIGVCSVRMWMKFGDIIKDINALLKKHKFDYTDRQIGGFGSVHLFVCEKK